MTEEEFRILERRMAINRGELGNLLACGHPATIEGICGIPWCGDDVKSSIEWPEDMIEAECTRLLEQDGWRALRTDSVSDRGKGKGFGELGMADHLYFRWAISETARACAWCQVLWVEFKSAKGKPSKKQVEWHTIERARGAITWIAGVDFPASVAGFVEHYRASGLNRGIV